MNFFDFLKHPHEQIRTDNRPSQLLLTGLWFFGTLVLSVLLSLPFILQDVILPFKPILWESPLKEVLVTVLAAPLREEIISRLPLRRSKCTILASLFVVSYSLISVGFGIKLLLPELAFLRLVLAAAATALLWFVIKKPVGRMRYAHFFYLMAILFGLMHLTNIDFKVFVITLPALLNLLSYLTSLSVSGMIFGYARMKHGFWAAILLHMFNNAIPLLVFGL